MCLLLALTSLPASASVHHYVFGLDPGTAYDVLQQGQAIATGVAPSPAGAIEFIAPLASPITIQPSGTPADLIPPAAPGGLQAITTGPTTLLLSWTAPGDDGWTGTASLYEVRVSTGSIEGAAFFTATEIPGAPVPAPAGTAQSMTVSGLLPGTTYFFAIRARDDAFNWSPASTPASVTLPGLSGDLTPPGRVTDLAAVASAQTVTLSWTAPGDDGSTGTAVTYQIRSASSLLTESTFTFAAVVHGAPPPAPAGTRQTMTISGFSADSRYYFALKTADEVPNWSGMSNVALAMTAVTPDTIPPDNITDMRVSAIGHRFATISWTAPSDGTGHRTHAYEGRLSDHEIGNENDWLQANPLEGLPQPSAPGTRDSVRVDGLEPAHRYYVAVRASDASGNLSALGPQVALTTTSAPDTLPPEPIMTLALDSATWTTLRMQWLAPSDRIPEDCVVTPLVDRYDLRFGPWPPPADIWSSGQEGPAGTPAPPGTLEQTVISGLTPDTEYFVAVRSRDARGFWSETSNIVRASTLPLQPSSDETPPAAVADLEVEVASGPSVVLSWTAPGDDGSDGTATVYDLRISTEPITTSGFESATAVGIVPAPLAAGSRQWLTLAGIHPEQTYYFVLRAADEVPNWSPLSNEISISTAGPPDTLSPEPITDYTVTQVDHRAAHLSWTAPADRGGGIVASYEGRVAEHAIYSEYAWGEATPIAGLPIPSAPGTMETAVVAGLEPARSYHVAIRARDDAGNLGPLEPGVSFSTTSAPDTIPPQAITTLAVASATATTLRVRWVAPRDSVPEDCVQRPRVARYNFRYGPWPPPADPWATGLEAPTDTPGPPQSIEEVVITDLVPSRQYFLVVRSMDDRGNWSGPSNVVQASTGPTGLPGDSDPPGQVTDLAAEAVSFNTVLLSWTAPGGDGNTGQAEYYDVRRSTRMLTPDEWPMGVRITPIKPCRSAGEPESLRVGGLQGDRTYYFALRAVDREGNIGPISPMASAQTPAAPDTIPPSTIADLTAAVVDSVTALLTWTAPGDRGGVCIAYSMRRAFRPIEEATWAGADTVGGLGTPRTQGAAESLLVSGLPRTTVVVFALRSEDASGNWSAISNLCPVVTDSSGGPPEGTEDHTPPAAISDLAAEAVDATHVRLTWTAVGDDGPVGRASFYDGRRADSPIDSTTWAPAQAIEIPFQPGSAGAAETLLVAGLEPDTEHYFAIRARDESGNVSPLATGASAITPPLTDATAPGTPADVAAAQNGDAVLLRWSPPADADLAGFLVYRQSPNHPPEPIPSGRADAPTFRDTTVVPQQEYVYTVSAVDSSGNESPRSADVHVTPSLDGFMPVITDFVLAPPSLDPAGENGRADLVLAWTCVTGERFGRFAVDGRPEEAGTWEREAAPVIQTESGFTFSKNLDPGRFRFRIVAVSPRGYERELAGIPVDVEAPSTLMLGAPFPNPTSGTFALQASAPSPLRMCARLYDASGRLQAILMDAIVERGMHTWSWDRTSISGTRLASGVYYLELRLGDTRRVHKIVVRR